jgi:hypothetical protein
MRATDENLSTAKTEETQSNSKAKRPPPANTKPVTLYRNTCNQETSTLDAWYPENGPRKKKNATKLIMVLIGIDGALTSTHNQRAGPSAKRQGHCKEAGNRNEN